MKMEAKLVRSGTHGSLWLDGEVVAACYGCTAVVKKNKTEVALCGQMMTDHKMTSMSGTGTVRIYSVSDELMKRELAALAKGQDLRHTIISKLDDPDNPNVQRFAVSGVSFDEVKAADWEAAKLGSVEIPFTFSDLQDL